MALFLLIALCVLIFLVLLKIYTKVSSGECRSKERMDGKVVIVTGANTGIGYECSLDLARRGARVILACRSREKATLAKNQIIAYSGNSNIHVMIVDLASFESVRQFSKEVLECEKYIHVLVNNAGGGRLGQRKTSDGLLPGLQVNHFGPFLLTNLLLGRLRESAPSRVVNVSSCLHGIAWFDIKDIHQNNWKNHSDLFTYCNTKLLNILMSNELARRMGGTGVTSNSLHPGGVKTNLMENYPTFGQLLIWSIIRSFYKNVREGAQTQILLSVDPALKYTTGKYFSDCQESKPFKIATDAVLAKQVWDLSEQVVGLQKSERYYI